MSRYIEHQEFIHKSEIPEEMPEGITIKYYISWLGEAKEITTDSLRLILKKLRSGKWKYIILANDEDMEGDFMRLESGNDLYALQFFQYDASGTGEGILFSTYDLEYLNSDEESDIECSDGQSIILRRYTTTDIDSVMAAIEYFIRTGKLWNGIQWMKEWEE